MPIKTKAKHSCVYVCACVRASVIGGVALTQVFLEYERPSTHQAYIVYTFLQSLEARVEERRGPFKMAPSRCARERDGRETEGPSVDEETMKTFAHSLDLPLRTHDPLYAL